LLLLRCHCCPLHHTWQQQLLLLLLLLLHPCPVARTLHLCILLLLPQSLAMCPMLLQLQEEACHKISPLMLQIAGAAAAVAPAGS
jgi:hypothetical protein